MFPYGDFVTVWVAGEPVFVISRSVLPTTHAESDDWAEPSFEVATGPVFWTFPTAGQEPTPVRSVVGEMMCTVKVLAACVVPAGTVTGPHDSVPDTIAHCAAPVPQPEPCDSIVQARPGFAGNTSDRLTPYASPPPEFETVSVNPI